jgi:hypothetical protein
MFTNIEKFEQEHLFNLNESDDYSNIKTKQQEGVEQGNDNLSTGFEENKVHELHNDHVEYEEDINYDNGVSVLYETNNEPLCEPTEVNRTEGHVVSIQEQQDNNKPTVSQVIWFPKLNEVFDTLLFAWMVKDLTLGKEDQFERNFLLCWIKAYSLVINNLPHSLGQEKPVSVFLFCLYSIPLEKEYWIVLLAILLAALPQVIRLKEYWSRYYLKMRKYRIVAGPTFGILLFRLITLEPTLLGLIAFAIFNIGVYFRPDKKEHGGEGFGEYAKRHGRIMIVCFGVLVCDTFLKLIKK